MRFASRAKLGICIMVGGYGAWSEDQRQNLDAFGFGNAHPPAKNPREGWGNRRRKGDLRR